MLDFTFFFVVHYLFQQLIHLGITDVCRKCPS